MPAYNEVLNLLLLLIAAAVMSLYRVYTGDWHGGVRHGRCVVYSIASINIILLMLLVCKQQHGI
jgi:hypothetical protein